MVDEEITPIELNRIEKQVLAAEIDPKKVVTLDARTARTLVEAYKGNAPIGGGIPGSSQEDELRQSKERVRELERAIEDARYTLANA